MDLAISYLGITLRTPLVPSASPLSEDLAKIKQMEQAGASAVVLHSLFEEQTELDTAARPEFRIVPDAYLKHIAEAKRSGKPLLVTLRCVPCMSCMKRSYSSFDALVECTSAGRL